MSWFGSLDLAYKYTTVFGALLLLTILAGLCKVLYNRRRLKNFAKKQSSEEAGPSEDQVELNQREKDEGDLFGVRAIEAGFYAGIPQSRPTSRAGSYTGNPSMNSSALIGSLNALKMNTSSMASSVTSLPLAHTAGGNRDSDQLPDSPPRRKAPPAITLGPSEAELSGRNNHNAAVNMDLNVPPSPVLARRSASPLFNGSDGSDSDNGRISPSRLSPHTASFRQEYSSVPPQLPMPQLLHLSVHSAEDMLHSQAASFNDPSPGHSAPSSSGIPPTTKLPSMPRATRDEPNQPPTNVLLQPQSYQPTHQRDTSNASSVYSENRMSLLQQSHHRSESSESGYSYNYSFPEMSNRNSGMQPTKAQEQAHQKGVSSSLLNAGPANGSSPTNDPRFSDFYDAYYRHSQLDALSKTNASKRPDQTVVEVASPAVPTSRKQPGLAM